MKIEVSKILFENGTVELFEPIMTYDPILLDGTKKVIVENITQFGFEHANPKRSYAASFDNDYLSISIPDIYKSKQSMKGVLYDFSQVMEFQRVSKRRNNMAYVNVWVMECRNKEKNKWRKYKLVIRVKGHDKAKIIMDALKDLNKLLLLKLEEENK